MSKQAWNECLIASPVDGSAKTAAAIATILPGQALYTLPANFFEIGRALRITASGRVTVDSAQAGSCRFSVKFGSIVVFDGLAVPTNTTADKTNVGWWLQILLTCRAVGTGTSANLMGQGFFTSEAVIGSPLPSAGGLGTIILPYNSAPAVGSGFDSTDAQQVDLHHTQTQSGGTPAESITLHQYILEALN